MSLVLGVGSDVQGTSVEIRDQATGRLVASGGVAHRGAADGTQHPETWWDGMVDAIAATEIRQEVAGLAVAAQRQALVLLDGAGSPVMAASLRTDTRAEATASAIAAKLGPAKLARSTGQVPRGDTPLARLAWHVEHHSALAARVTAVLGATEHLTLRLTGRFVADRGSASGTGWWDPSGERWRTDLLDRVARGGRAQGWAGALAEVVGPARAADRVAATQHGLVGLRGRPVVATGTDDLMARAVAAGVAPGGTALLLGPDPVAVGVRDEATVDETGEVCSFADATGRHLPTVGVLDVGPVLDAAARLLGTDAIGLAALAAAATGRSPSDAPVVVGFRAGGPGGRPGARRGSLLGLHADHSPGDVALAALHGVAAELLDAVDLLGVLTEDAPLLLAGPQAAWPGLAAAVADLLGSPVVVGEAGGAATGACVLAAAALDDVDPLQVAAAWGLDTGTEVEPSGTVDGVAVREAIAASHAM